MNQRNQIESKGFVPAVLVWTTNIAALFLAASVVPGVSYRHLYSIPAAAVVLWVATWLIEPFLYLLALPITIASFGLFTVVINGVVLILVAKVPHGFAFSGRFWGLLPAILTSLIISFFRLILRTVLVRLRAARRS